MGERERGRGEELSQPKFKPMTVARDAWMKDPSACQQEGPDQKNKGKNMENDAQIRLQHAEHQGQLLCDKPADIWSSGVQQLPPQVLTFSLV